MSFFIYVAEFKYGSAHLTEVEVEKETDKTFVKKDKNNYGRRVLGDNSIYGIRVLKGRGVYLTQVEAVDYLLQEIDLFIVDLGLRLKNAGDTEQRLKLFKESLLHD